MESTRNCRKYIAKKGMCGKEKRKASWGFLILNEKASLGK
jgi:hypothetical protein